MKPELDQQLCEQYPQIFANRHSSMQTTAMCWGFECGSGWFDLIDRLCWNIQNHIDWNNQQRVALEEHNPHCVTVPPWIQQVVATQVKEKFGTLRFYYSGGDDTIGGMVQMAESMSAVTCEQCGNRGQLRGRGWFYAACDEHTRPEDLDDVDSVDSVDNSTDGGEQP
jgi:hypothetical protein